jgi:hypothetical protein
MVALALSGCATATSTPTPATPEPKPIPPGTPTPAPTAEERPPAGAASQFSTDFDRHSVPYDEILSGGPSKDGIPALDEPTFVDVPAAGEWLAPDEAVIVLLLDGEARAYPLQVLMWHEVVNDELRGVPVAVTYCPLCNTAVAFQRTHQGRTLDFGTTGRLRFSNMIMYDRQTESWWQQATGEAIVGDLTGQQLTKVPAFIVAWRDFRRAYPEGQVLSRETGYTRDYGRNPYVGYDAPNRTPFLYRGPETPDVLPQMARVLAVDRGDDAVTYPYAVLEEARVVSDTVGGAELVVFWAPGKASALDAAQVAEGRDVGAVTAFSPRVDGRALTFAPDGERFVDRETSSVWNLFGQAVDGPLSGRRLEPVAGVNYFWFARAAFAPLTAVYGRGE